MLESHRSPLVLIRYKTNGIMPRYGLRFDLDKRAFLDHLEDVGQDAFVGESAPRIVEIVGSERQRLSQTHWRHDG